MNYIHDIYPKNSSAKNVFLHLKQILPVYKAYSHILYYGIFMRSFNNAALMRPTLSSWLSQSDLSSQAPSTKAVDLCGRFPTRREGTQQRQEERLAEAAERRGRLEIERLTDDVRVVFVQDDPKTQVRIETGPPFLECGDLGGEARSLRLFGGDRKEQNQITGRPRKAHTDGDRAILAPLGLTRSSLTSPEIGVANDDAGLEVIEAHGSAGSSSRA